MANRMARLGWIVGWLGAFLAVGGAGGVAAAEVGLVTAVAGKVRLQEEKAAASELKAFVKLREGDRLTLDAASRLQLVFFDGGRQETWKGSGALEVGTTSSKVVKGNPQSEVRTLPPILVKQLIKTPSPDGNVKAGMIRMRSMPSGGTLESIEKNYAELRKQAEAADRNPELYLLAGYFELREFDRIETVLKQLGDKAPGDPEVKLLGALYQRAINDAKAAPAK